MFKLILSASLMVLISFSVSLAADDSIKVVPGNYSITTTTRSNMSPNPMTDTEDKCITDTSYNPRSFMSEDDGCTASNMKKNANKLNFDIKCNAGQGMPNMAGKGEASATSSTISSHYKMAGTFQGREVSWDSKSEGKRTGDCK
jgi:hypothetical protein